MPRQIWMYVIFTFGISWSLWMLLISSGMSSAEVSNNQSPIMLLWPLGQYGPFFAAILMAVILRFGDSSSQSKAIEGRLMPSFRQPKWYLVFLLPLLLIAPAYFYAALFSQAEPIFDAGAWMMLFLPAIAFSFGEELGWRGYMLPRLLKKYSPLTASLLLGGVWSIWHIPILFFSVYQSAWQFTVFLIGYIPVLLLWTIVFTWAYERAGRNLWVVILLHASFTATYNFSAPVIADSGIIGSLLPILTILFLVWRLVRRDKKYWLRPAVQ